MRKHPSRPNLLLILDDQHRFDYLGSAGAAFLHTPNLDRLAERGVRFTRCYTTAPVCAPARISLATGLAAHRFGGRNNAVYLPLSRRTYYQRLRDLGYRVGCVGKLDLAKPAPYNSDGARPACFSWGFTHPEECEGKMHAGQGPGTPFGPYTAYLYGKGLLKRFTADYHRRRREGYALSAWDSVLDTEDFEDAYIGVRAARWIDTVPDDYPWHLFVSFVGPHDPFDPPVEFADRYRHAGVPPPVASDPSTKPVYVQGRQVRADAGQITVCRRQYCAAIELIDHQVGLILDALERRGMTDHTYVFFSSDHGEMLGDHGLFAKSVPYESAAHVPLLACGPGIAGNRVSAELVELADVNPTLCELAGLPRQDDIDARSFLPLLRGETSRHRDEILMSLGHFRCLVHDRWKFIETVNDRNELYDLEADPGEQHNVLAGHRDIAADLRQRLQQRWLAGECNR